MDSCPEKVNALMGESGAACPAERTQLTGEGAVGFGVNSPGLKNKLSLVISYCCCLACVFLWYWCALCLNRLILLLMLHLILCILGVIFNELSPRDKTTSFVPLVKKRLSRILACVRTL